MALRAVRYSKRASHVDLFTRICEILFGGEKQFEGLECDGNEIYNHASSSTPRCGMDLLRRTHGLGDHLSQRHTAVPARWKPLPGRSNLGPAFKRIECDLCLAWVYCENSSQSWGWEMIGVRRGQQPTTKPNFEPRRDGIPTLIE